MATFEVWELHALSSGTFASEHYIIDTAMASAIKLSKGTNLKRVIDPKNPGYNGWYGAMNYIDIQVPKAYCIVDRSGQQAVIRGWAVNGKYNIVKDCKRCNSTGIDYDTGIEMGCRSCNGCSYQPQIR
jgi:hypothetical protein